MTDMNQNAGAATFPGGADAAPGGGGSVGTAATGDATRAEREAAAAALVASGSMTEAQAAALLAEPQTLVNQPNGTASAAEIADIAQFAGSLNPADAKAWLAGDVKSGALSQKQADEILAGRAPAVEPGANITPESVSAMKTSAVAADIDAAFPPGKASDFNLPVVTDQDGSADSAGTIATVQAIRGALETAGVTKEIGSFIANEAARGQAEWEKLDDTGQQLHRQKTMVALEKRYGEKTPEKIELARQLIREVNAKHPGIMELLDHTGASNSAVIIGQVIEHAERLLAKRGITSWPPKSAA